MSLILVIFLFFATNSNIQIKLKHLTVDLIDKMLSRKIKSSQKIEYHEYDEDDIPFKYYSMKVNHEGNLYDIYIEDVDMENIYYMMDNEGVTEVLNVLPGTRPTFIPPPYIELYRETGNGEMSRVNI